MLCLSHEVHLLLNVNCCCFLAEPPVLCDGVPERRRLDVPHTALREVWVPQSTVSAHTWLLSSFDQKCTHLDLNSFDCNTSVWPQVYTSDLTLLTTGEIIWLLTLLTTGAHILAVNSFSLKWTHLTLNSFDVDEYCLTQLFWPQYHISDSIHFDHIDSLHFNHIFTHLTFNCFDSKQDIFGLTFIATSEHIFLLTLQTMSTHMTLKSFDQKFTHGIFNTLDHEHLNLTSTRLTANAHIWHCYFCVKCFDIRLKRGVWSTDLAPASLGPEDVYLTMPGSCLTTGWKPKVLWVDSWH